MIAFEAVLLPDNRLQILKPGVTFTRPQRVIITVLDEESEVEQGQDNLKVPITSTLLESLSAGQQEEGWLPRSTRVPNLHAGLIQMSDDFDDPLPDSFWLGEEDAG